MKATAISYGAATIVNAIATGRGAAFGIGLWTKATVELDESNKIRARIKGHPAESTELIEHCVKETLRYFGFKKGAVVVTESNIPIARGLKSSSTAANSVVLATASALAKEHRIEKVSDLTLINLGVDAAIKAGVTITGAFDDASASYFGGFVVTDNTKREILKKGPMKPHRVLIFVPRRKSYTHRVDVKRTRLLSKAVDMAWDNALKGDIHQALTLNGLLYSLTLNQNHRIALEALKSGAISTGLSGTGPSVVALTRGSTDEIIKSWKRFSGEIIETRVNNKKATVI